MNKDEWLKLLKEQKAQCYIKPNRHKHSSGYRCFDVGYLVVDKNGTRVADKLVLGKTSDGIILTDFYEKKPDKLRMDLLLDGYIRIWGDKPLWWGHLDKVLSDSDLRLLD